MSFDNYGKDGLEIIDFIIGSELTEGSKLSLVVAEYHKLYAIKKELDKSDSIGRFGYQIAVPADKLEKIAIEIYSEQNRAENLEEIKRWKKAYEDLKQSLRDLK